MMKRARDLLLLGGIVVFLISLISCKKKTSSSKSKTKPKASMAGATKTKPMAPTAMRAAPKAKKPDVPAKSSEQVKEEQGTVLRVLKQRGSRTIITSKGTRRVKMPTSYEARVGLADGTRLAFYPLKTKPKKGSKVTVSFSLKGNKKVGLVLKGAVAMEKSRIRAKVLPSLKETPVTVGGYGISFPWVPKQKKTNVGTLLRYEYKFDESYRPDTYYFISVQVKGGGGKKFFKKQAERLLALTGGRRIAVRIGGPRKVRKTDLRTAKGRFSVEIENFQQVGRIQLWLDSANKTLYGAWMHAYSRNRLAEEKGMQRKFFRSFGPKQ